MARRADGDLPATTSGGERRQRLLAIKLAALITDRLGSDAAITPASIGRGAAARASGAAWVLVDDQPERQLGAAIAWALRAGEVERLHVFADDGAGVLARRATHFRLPITVWDVDGRDAHEAVAEPLGEPPTPAPEHLTFVELIADAGATPLIEHGVVFGEVRGLEVCRVVDRADSGEPALEVGVGAHDREAFAIIHGDVPTGDALADVVQQVARFRSPDQPSHPLNRLARSRYLRWSLEQRPDLIDAEVLTPAEPPLPRPNVKDAVPCTASALRDGIEVAVVCSVGGDLDLIPYVADVQRSGRPTVAVVPGRDLLPVTSDLADQLTVPVELRAID